MCIRDRLAVRKTNTRLAERSFSFSSAAVWNFLPDKLRSADVDHVASKRNSKPTYLQQHIVCSLQHSPAPLICTYSLLVRRQHISALEVLHTYIHTYIHTYPKAFTIVIECHTL